MESISIPCKLHRGVDGAGFRHDLPRGSVEPGSVALADREAGCEVGLVGLLALARLTLAPTPRSPQMAEAR